MSLKNLWFIHDLAEELTRIRILTRLDYCNSLLCGATVEVVSELERLQNNVARIVLKADRQ